MKCLNCDADLMQGKGKREKIFCDSTCRSNYWQKSKRLENEGLSVEEIIAKIKKSKKSEVKISDLNRETQKVKDVTEEKPKTNYTVNTKKQMPPKLDKIAQLRWLRENQ